MKKTLIIITVFLLAIFILFLIDKTTNIQTQATYYRAEYPEHQDTLNNILDIEIDVNPSIVKKIYLKRLVLYKDCIMSSPNGSTESGVEEEINIRQANYSVLRIKDKIILRFNTLEFPYHRDKCSTIYSGSIEIRYSTDRKNDTKKFSIDHDNFKSIIARVRY